MQLRPIALHTILTVILCALPASPVAAEGFDQPVEYGVGPKPYSVAIGDLDGDGTSDLAVANYSGGNISVLLGLGDGTYQEQVVYGCGQNPTSIAIGDLNLDDCQDLAVTNYYSASASVLLGNGDGTFQAGTAYTVGTRPRSVIIADLDEDGFPDLVTANAESDSISVLAGDGSGTFPAGPEFPVGDGPWYVVTSDFDLDGVTDLAVANAVSNDVSILLGNGDGTFDTAGQYPSGWIPCSIAVGDLNNDGIPDLAVAHIYELAVFVLLGNGDGTLQQRVGYNTSFWTTAVAIDDFDGDGHPDLAVANTEYPVAGSHLDMPPVCDRLHIFGWINIFPGIGNGTLGEMIEIEVGGHPCSIATKDFNGDGFPDLVVADQDENNVSVLISLGRTVSAELTCVPSSGTLPFNTRMTATLGNRYIGQRRRIGASIDVITANGNHFPSWRAGFMNLLPGHSKTSQWSQSIPMLGSLLGDNQFRLLAEDITPAPYNLPPYPPSGDTDYTYCVVTGIAP